LIEHISKHNFVDISEELFFRVLHTGFAAKRKQLGGNLSTVFGKDVALNALVSCSIDPTIRSEELPVEKWLEITRALTGKIPS
jgi:16S rRNA A1518/A1519 N6-dimethyltransferase RsmA/KsgA/DIM1 with predicted DNA glycosylase/AP lyase activity